MKTYRWAGNPKPISNMVMGTMIIGLSDYAKSAELLDAALESGINAFDLAHVYGGGDSERAFGRWMEERGNRERIFLITKGAHPNGDRARVTPCDIESDLRDSLARLRTDYVDAYLLHRDDPAVPVGPIVEALNAQMKAGRIRAFGGSNWAHGRIEEANRYAGERGLAPMSVSSPNFGLMEQLDDPWGPGCVTISGAAGEEARAYYRREGIPVLAYSSLGRGMLSGRVDRENYKELLDGAALRAYAHESNFRRVDRARELAASMDATVPQIGLAYLMSQPIDVFPIVGAASAEELAQTVRAAELTLTRAQCEWLERGDREA